MMQLKHIAGIFLCSCLFFVAFAAKKDGDKLSKYYKRTGEKFLAEKAKQEGVYVLKSGMLVEILKQNPSEDAKSPRKDDPCDVTYSGTLRDGTPFDASRTSFSPSQVIKA